MKPIITVVLLLCFSHVVKGQSDFNINQLVSWNDGSTLALASASIGGHKYVIFNQATSLVIANIDDSSLIRKTGVLVMPDIPRKIIIRGTTAYVADYEAGFHIVDISDPSNPKETGSFIPPQGVDGNTSDGLAVQGHFAYVGNERTLWVLDISDPTRPASVGKLQLPAWPWYLDVAGNYLYETQSDSTVRIIDISNPAHPSILTQYHFSCNVHDALVSGNYLYVSGGSGLFILNIGDPAHPLLAGSFTQYGFYKNITQGQSLMLSGTRAFLSDGGGVLIVDISSPANPQELGRSWNGKGWVQNMAVSGNILCETKWDGGLILQDISNPSSIKETAHYTTANETMDVAIAGQYAYVANGWSGLEVVDLTAKPPASVANYFAPSYSRSCGIALLDTFALIAEFANGVRTIDIANPANPIDDGSFNTNGEAWAIRIAGAYAYVANGPGGLAILNISDPKNPIKASSLSLSGYAQDLTLAGEYAFIAGGNSGLRIVNIADPTRPLLVSTFPVSDYALGIDVQNGLAYLCGDDAQIKIIDVHNPAKPTPLDTIFWSSAENAIHAKVHNGLAFISTWPYGLRVYDVSNPKLAKLIGAMNVPGNAYTLKFSNDSIYFCAGEAGLRIYQYVGPPAAGVSKWQAQPNGDVDLSVFPNPAHDAFTISFTNPVGQPIHYEIADVLGRIITTGETSESRLSLSARALPEGVLLLRASSGGIVQTRRFIVAR